MISVGIVLLILAACFYYGILYSNQVMVTIGYALGLVLLVSVIELLYRFFTLQCKIQVLISMQDQGKPVQVIVKIRNKGFLPTDRVDVKIENKNVFRKRKEKRWLTISDISAGEQKYPIYMDLKGAGRHDIFVTQWKIYSVFGLVHIKRRRKDSASVLVMPEIYPMNVQITEAVRNFLGDADIYDEYRPGHDSGETFEIRPYREKDKLQSIHWKLSAKMDMLMVKENSLPKACAVVLMPECKPWQGKKHGKKKADAGAFLNLTASLSYSLMEQKCPHFVAWYSVHKEDICRIRVDDEESFYLFMDAYLKDVVSVEKDIRQEYRKKYKNEWYLYDLTINENMELYRNGEFITKLNEKKIKDECEKLELLL